MSVKKILHLFSKYQGDYPLVDDLLLRLDRGRYESVVCFLRGRPENQTRLEKNGIETVYLEHISSKRRGVSLSKLNRLKKIVTEKGIDLIHCQRHKPTVYGVLTSVLTGGIPVVTTVHGSGRTRSLRRKLVNRFLYKKVSRIITVSNSVKKDVLRTNNWLREQRVTTVQNGIECSKLLSMDGISKEQARGEILAGHEDNYWFGVVGRLTAVKNHERLVKAFTAVISRQPATVLLIAGSGELEMDLKDLIHDHGLQEKVHLLGYRRDIPMFLRSLDCFVFPSLSEGLGLALLEAMASRLPVIVSDIEASREVIDGCECGVFVDPMDIQEMGGAMLRMRNMDEERHRIRGGKGRRRVMESFAIERMEKGIVSIYDALLFPAGSA